jgi:hypothetical protein
MLENESRTRNMKNYEEKEIAYGFTEDLMGRHDPALNQKFPCMKSEGSLKR